MKLSCSVLVVNLLFLVMPSIAPVAWSRESESAVLYDAVHWQHGRLAADGWRPAAAAGRWLLTAGCCWSKHTHDSFTNMGGGLLTAGG